MIGKENKTNNPTIAVLALNEADMISRCIQSANFAEQILVIDSGSSDNTFAIAKSPGAETQYYPDWHGFAMQRNRALQHCRGDHAFFLDCDEIIPENLAKEILEAVQLGAINQGLIR